MDVTTPVTSSSCTVRARMLATSAARRSVAPTRSFHQPFAVAPSTLAASTSKVIGVSCTVWPGMAESRMEWKVGDQVAADPLKRSRLLVGNGGQMGEAVGVDSGVAPSAVVVDEGVAQPYLGSVDGRLLNGLAQGSLFDALVAVARTARETPRAAVVAPVGAVLEQDAQRAIGVDGVQQQPRCAVQPPMPVAELALDPAVAVALHGSWLSRVRFGCGPRDWLAGSTRASPGSCRRIGPVAVEAVATSFPCSTGTHIPEHPHACGALGLDEGLDTASPEGSSTPSS